MIVKCRWCGEYIDKSKSYITKINGKNEFFCSEEEYKKKQEYNRKKSDIINVVTDITGNDISFGILSQEIDIWLSNASYEQITGYLSSESTYLSNVMSNKTFETDYGKTRYFSAIVKNNTPKYAVQEVPKSREVDFEGLDYKYKQKPKRKTMLDYESEE